MTCTQPGCGGTVQDGYCGTCGLAAAGSESSSSSGPLSGSRSSRSRSRRTTGRSARGRLGAGLVEIPPVPYRDPASAVLADPRVPENRRYCSGCDQPVGLERSYRALARLTPDEDRRIELVDMANAIRPRTLT